MGRKRLSLSPGPEHDDPPGLEQLPQLGAERPEILDIRAAPLPERRRGTGALSPEPRIILTILFDTSSSMAHSGALDAGLASLPLFKASILGHSLLARKLSFSLVTFDDTVRVISPHRPVTDWTVPERLTAGHGTAMGTAIVESIDLQHAHVEEQASEGIGTQHSVLSLVTDGYPSGEPPDAFDRAIRAIHEAESTGRFSFFPIAVEGTNHEAANLDTLKRLSSRREPLALAKVDFAKLMGWLVGTLNTISASQPGERIRLSDPIKRADNPDGWGYLG